MCCFNLHLELEVCCHVAVGFVDLRGFVRYGSVSGGVEVGLHTEARPTRASNRLTRSSLEDSIFSFCRLLDFVCLVVCILEEAGDNILMSPGVLRRGAADFASMVDKVFQGIRILLWG